MKRLPPLEPDELAMATVREIMQEGLATHPAGSWQEEPQDFHLMKALRHLATYRLERDGMIPPDGEHHLKNALCRLAMGLALE